MAKLSKDKLTVLTGTSKELIIDFRFVFVALFLLTILFSGVFFFSSRNSEVVNVLKLSSRNPWGILTSIFVHTDFWHMTENLIGLLFFSAIFIVANCFLSKRERRNAAIFFVVAIFLAAMISNLLWIAKYPYAEGTVGASGIVFASNGVVLGFCMLNLLLIIIEMILHPKQDKIVLIGIWLFNLIIFLTLAFPILTNARLFLNVSENVNAYVHATSFVGGFILGIGWVMVLFIRAFCIGKVRSSHHYFFP